MDSGEDFKPVSDLCVAGTGSSFMEIGERTDGGEQSGGGVRGKHGYPVLQICQLVIKERERDLTRAGRRIVWPRG
ncbi:MAG: hypothetical protein K2X97_02145 [Mycobacteriaceae bacterium]|nr:hypothetical protein [Mycobacteriaceae bacterium]